jgi:hypothetical protein
MSTGKVKGWMLKRGSGIKKKTGLYPPAYHRNDMRVIKNDNA